SGVSTAGRFAVRRKARSDRSDRAAGAARVETFFSAPAQREIGEARSTRARRLSRCSRCAVNWLDWLRTLTTISQAGLAYSKDPFDRERYEQLKCLCAEIIAAHSGATLQEVTGHLEVERGYTTPKVDVRAVV